MNQKKKTSGKFLEESIKKYSFIEFIIVRVPQNVEITVSTEQSEAKKRFYSEFISSDVRYQIFNMSKVDITNYWDQK